MKHVIENKLLRRMESNKNLNTAVQKKPRTALIFFELI